MNKFFGEIIYYFAKLLEILFDGVIAITEVIVNLVKGLAKGFLALISMGGCLIIFLLAGPLGLFILFNPIFILIVVSTIIIIVGGTKLISYLKYRKYMVTEFLFDSAEYYRKGREKTFKSFDEYGTKYKNMEEEKRRKEWKKKQEDQQREWEERFRQWNEYQRQGGGFNQGGYNQGGYGGGNYQNPSIEFKKKYEESIKLLGLSNDADTYQIKLAYRKKAKEYHPDINKAENATAMFQKINEAYEFLNESNIERYETLK
ncbi:J domain-containing protein [Tissierella creatinophila]|uniref:Chaperone protein DnaJ n=1 Tax=Tissierella creatinophila DSM 6911 TaxID=1123403 RepID=A0A1U7M8Q8_TISCR|nr:DnaJ domain-containing protein [Tissierella creatinophila]OLS03661.1 chaperone protein DnaJ [Tissierella creatinophila DSM 6911]